MFITENLGKNKVEKEKRNTTASINHCEHFHIFFQVFFFNLCTCILKNMVLAFCSLLFSTVEYIRNIVSYLSVQFSRSVMSDSLWPYELQHARPPCPSPSPGVHWNSRPSSWGCHPAISSSVVPFSSCPQSLPASESFPMSQLFAWGGQSTGVSALADSFWYLAKLIQFCKV